VEAGWAAAGCLRAHGEKAAGLGGLRAERRIRPVVERGEERREGFSFFFLNSFQIRFSNLQTSNKQKSMHSKHDAQTLIISRLF
jgi:hypothetical protein